MVMPSFAAVVACANSSKIKRRRDNTPQVALLILAPRLHGNITILVGRHVQNDRPATDLAIFNVTLLGQ